jgi:AraC-like DNA-binding protein
MNFLTKMPNPSTLETLVTRLPQSTHQVVGRRTGVIELPDNIVCFQRRSASELNRPGRGRALHHRCVLIMALRTAVAVCVDDRVVRLKAGEGLLVLPFQFHHYMDAERDSLCWCFVTFDLTHAERLESLRFRPFRLTPPTRAMLTELLEAFEDEGSDSHLLALLLALLLARLSRNAPTPPVARARPGATAPGLALQVNQLAQRHREKLGVKEMAHALGISPSHLRARFRVSTGVSIGRHLRRLRLDKACGLLRLTPHRVSEIAEQCGFNSIYHFSRAFQKTYGVSPMSYRHGAEVKLARERRTKAV